MAFQQPVQAGPGQAGDLRLEREQHVVERQQGLLAEPDDRASSIGVRTVLGLIPNCRASIATGAFDRCSSARTACVALAQPWRTSPIARPSGGDHMMHLHNLGLNILERISQSMLRNG